MRAAENLWQIDFGQVWLQKEPNNGLFLVFLMNRRKMYTDIAIQTLMYGHYQFSIYMDFLSWIPDKLENVLIE